MKLYKFGSIEILSRFFNIIRGKKFYLDAKKIEIKMFIFLSFCTSITCCWNLWVCRRKYTSEEWCQLSVPTVKKS